MTDAFAESVAAERGRLLAYAARLCRDPDLAEDLVHDAILNAMVYRHSFELGTNVSAWLNTILRNVYFSVYRNSRRVVSDLDGEIANSIPVDGNPDLGLRVKDALSLLESERREWREAVAMLARGYSLQEISDALGIPVGTVKSRINRARSFLVEVDA